MGFSAALAALIASSRLSANPSDAELDRLRLGLPIVARRSRAGVGGSGLAYLVIGLAADLTRYRLYWLGLALMAVLVIFRARLLWQPAEEIRRDPWRWQRWSRPPLLVIMALWSAAGATIVITHGWSDLTSLSLLITVAITSFSVSTYAADLPFTYLLTAILLLPAAWSLTQVPGSTTYWALAALTVFLVFSLLAAHRGNELFWTTINKTIELERHTNALEQVQHQLIQARADLEHQVEERTRELASANRMLEDDVQMRIALETSLRQRQEDYQRIFEQAHDAILILDPHDETILNANQRACALYGYSRQELLSTSLRRLSVDPSRGEEHLRRTLSTGSLYSFETRQFRRDGQILHLEVNAGVLEYEGRTAILSINRDVTERKLAESWRLAKEAAEQTARTKNEFFANLSHELRTPIGGIIGLVELLINEPLPADARAYALTLRATSRSLLQLIDDILDFSKIEAGRLVFEQAPFDLRATLSAVLDLMRPQADAKHVSLRAEIDEALPAGFLGDEARVRQVLVNLIGNAVKFTEQGSVRVRIESAREPDASHYVCILVEDTGVGIPPEARERIFEPFSQADSSTSRRFGGTGLGLAICRRILAAMGGHIDVESTPGRGSIFRVEIPLEATGEPQNPVQRREAMVHDRADRARYRVLIVEDNEVNRIVALRQVEALGYRADTAVDGQDALTKSERETYDAILMDCQMPMLDGYETTRRLRARSGHQPLVIAVTAYAMKGDREKCLAAGMDDYLPKPFEQRDLDRVLALHLDRERPPTVEPTMEVPVDRDILDHGTLAALRSLENDSDSTFLADAIDLFFSSGDLPALERAVAGGDLDAAKRLAHTIKGASATLGARRLAEACAQLEAAATEAPSRASAAWEKVRLEHARAESALRAEIGADSTSG